MKRLPLFLLPLLAACSGSELYSGLSEHHANEMIVALMDADISASKKADGDGTWAVTASSNDFAHAVAVLDAAGFPREEHESMGDLFRKKGLVPSETEERARYVYGLTQELSATLSALDGVIVARVHVVSPKIDPFAKEQAEASASVFIKHELGTDLSEDVGPIKSLVANAVEGLNYENVSVAFFEAAPVAIVPRSDPIYAQAPLAASIGLLGALGLGAGGYALRRGRAEKSHAKAKQAIEDKGDDYAED